MAQEKQSAENGNRDAEKRIATLHPVKRMLLLDVLNDRESRPVFLWAAGALLTGVLAYYWLEGWSLLDSLYFCVVTLTTIGYGDLVPSTPLARLFTVFYVINGIAILLALFDRIRDVRTREIMGDRQGMR